MNNCEPVHPISDQFVGKVGMTKRDLFAVVMAHALIEMYPARTVVANEVTANAVKMADALIAELAKEEPVIKYDPENKS